MHFLIDSYSITSHQAKKHHFLEPKKIILQAAAEAVDREFVYIELEEASPTIPHITDPRSQSPRIPPPDAGCWMPDPRCRIPECHFEAWLGDSVQGAILTDKNRGIGKTHEIIPHKNLWIVPRGARKPRCD